MITIKNDCHTFNFGNVPLATDEENGFNSVHTAIF